MQDIFLWLAQFVGTTIGNTFNFKYFGNVSVGSTLVYFAIVMVAIRFIKRVVIADEN